MRRVCLLALFLAFAASPLVAQHSGEGSLPARANVVAYEEESMIVKGDYHDSPYYYEISGIWKQRQTDSSTVYSKELDVQKFWKDYLVFLNVRCGKACRVKLNGKVVGYGDDSRHCNEFQLNKYLKYGKANTLEVEAMKRADGALLEREDMPVGLEGSPYILFKNDPNIADYVLNADYEAGTQTGTLSVDATVYNSRKKGKYYVEVEVLDPQGRTLDRMGRWVVFGKGDREHVDLGRSWGNVKPWSAEDPVLYTAILRLRNEDMEEEEALGARFGFRRVEVKEGVLMVNGSPITLKGILCPIADEDSHNGREALRSALRKIKSCNINAVRTTAFSPKVPAFYEMCDEYGLYVVCDANLLPVSSQHQAVATDRDFIPLFEHRVENLYGKYKNYTSIIMWSLGDTRDNGVCMTAAYNRLKELEQNRPVVFAGADYSESTDIVAFDLPTEQVLRQAVSKTDGRPIIMTRMVSSDNFADLDGIWKLVENNRVLQGGFCDVWDNTAVMDDLRNLFCPVTVGVSKLTTDDGEFMVSNRNDFVSLSGYDLEYIVYTNLRSNISAGELTVMARPGGMEKVTFPLPKAEMQPGEEMFIRFDLTLKRSKLPRWHSGKAASRLMGTTVFPLPQRKKPVKTFANEGTPLDSVLVPLSQSLFFVGNENLKAELLDQVENRPDERTACYDKMMKFSVPGGNSVCDVRSTYTCYSTGDVVVDYQISPAERMKGKLQPAIRVDFEADSVVWFGLDREAMFESRGLGIPGTYSAAVRGMKRNQVRWCALYKGESGLFVQVLGNQCQMAVSEHGVALTPNAKEHFRLYMRPFSGDSPEQFAGAQFPVVKSNMLEPPTIKANTARFSSTIAVSMASVDKGEIRYTLDGSDPTAESPVYTEPITLSSTTVVKARVFVSGMPPSFTATRKFSYDYVVSTTFSRKPNTPYNVGADTLLFDGEKGGVENLAKGWIGFSGSDVTTTVTLAKEIVGDNLVLRYAHNPATWVFAPKQVKVILYAEGHSYKDTLTVAPAFNPAEQENATPQVVELRVPLDKKSVSKIKIETEVITSIPQWHKAKGLKPWLLMDEIEVVESSENDNGKVNE